MPELGCMAGALPLCPWKEGQRGHRCSYNNNSIGNSGTPESGEMTEALPPALLKDGQQGRRCLFITESQVILLFIKMDLKKIYFSYSRTHINSEQFSIISAIIF